MDGNRRWASEQGKPKILGHSEGAKNLERILNSIIKMHIPYATFWALSTENLKRSEEELKHIFSLFGKITEYLKDAIKNNARFEYIGNLSLLPENIQKKLIDMKEKTKSHTGTVVTIAAGYGGRDELLRAAKKLLIENINPEELTEELFASMLDTAGMPDIDLIIRTGGNQRLSGYLPWQSPYAELYFTNTKWPGFDETELQKAIEWYNEQKRNFGK